MKRSISRLQTLCDENGLEGIPCKVCRKMIYPATTIDHDATPPHMYYHVVEYGLECFIHVNCMRLSDEN